MTYVVPEDVVWKDMDNLVVVVNVNSGDYYSLNATASEVWRAVVDGKNKEEAMQRVVQNFDVSDGTSVENEINNCLQYWLEEGLLSSKGSNG